MSLLDKILTWATAELKTWQRDALRRLCEKETLDDQDFDDLYGMLKAAHGLNEQQNRQPVPLAREHLPVLGGGAKHAIIHALRDLKHVNRIAHGQKLEFAPNGITVIYGGNASGKSGYSRVLKRACRARDISETIHPNAFDPNASTNVPEATFDIEVGGRVASLCWKRGETPPDGLSTISVFDGRCARAYIDSEQDVAYLPYGLDMVENLGQRVLPELTKRLNSEIETINTDTSPFDDLRGETTVGKMITSLSATTDPQKIKDLATVTDAETNRLTELDKILAEQEPQSKAKALRLVAQRIDGLVSRIDTAISWVDDIAVEKFKNWDNETEIASKAEAVTAEEFREGERLLPGTGDLVWKNLFEAARRYSTEVAYPSKSFPNVDPNARCLLCQQPFDQDAAKRMSRFENYVKQDTAKIAGEKRKHREDNAQKLNAKSLNFGLDAANEEEIKQLDADLLQSIKEFEKKVEDRKTWILTAIKVHTWGIPQTLDGDPRPRLKSLSLQFMNQAADLNKATDVKQKKILETECTELRARSNLSSRLQPVLSLNQRMQYKQKLITCKDDLKTRAISDKAREFASQVVTAALRDALNTEFMLLGVGHVKVKLNERVEHGRMMYKLVLDLPMATTIRLDEVLSEGEQRAIAIGSFLAELHLSGHRGGIVFDDPVSSLDHHWRRRVARRLVEEAKNRQVIVLTHDTVFLGELRDEIEQQNVIHLMRH
ncbi:MAG: AAA family ATPase, partial [Planctomycetota bacterium]